MYVVMELYGNDKGSAIWISTCNFSSSSSHACFCTADVTIILVVVVVVVCCRQRRFLYRPIHNLGDEG